MTKKIGSSETEKALDINNKIGLMATWARRFGVITNGSMSVDDIKGNSLLKQKGIIAGLRAGITTEDAVSMQQSNDGVQSFVYLNPNSKDLNTLKKEPNLSDISILGDEKRVFIANSYYLTHKDMLNLIKGSGYNISGLDNLRMTYRIRLNKLYLQEAKNLNILKDSIKNVINKLLKLELINDKTLIMGYGTTITVKDYLGKDFVFVIKD